jgi:hypothetical protein
VKVYGLLGHRSPAFLKIYGLARSALFGIPARRMWSEIFLLHRFTDRPAGFRLRRAHRQNAFDGAHGARERAMIPSPAIVTIAPPCPAMIGRLGHIACHLR